MKKKLKKILAFSVALASSLAVFGISASANFGGGVAVMASGESIIKTGLFGKKLVFSDTDFKQGLAITDFDSITVTKLPPSNEGALMLAGRRVTEGMKIRRKNIGSLVFIPSDAEVTKSSFYFTISPYADGNEIEFSLKFTDKINYEPELSKTESEILTQRDVSVYGSLAASDREGDEITYMTISFPKHGTIEILDGENGKFRYTPHYGYVGEDEFSYVARDEWGNFSTLGKISVNVSERLSEVEFRDMKNSENYNAALTLSAMGIMEGKTVGDGVYFMPEDCVTKAEFVTMLMKTLNISKNPALSESFFDDDADIPKGFLPYVASAQRLGLITGDFVGGKLLFKPNEYITTYEAAEMIRKALGDKANVSTPDTIESDLPVYARDDAYIMCALGIFDGELKDISRNDKVTKEECASYLYKLLQM